MNDLMGALDENLGEELDDEDGHQVGGQGGHEPEDLVDVHEYADLGGWNDQVDELVGAQDDDHAVDEYLKDDHEAGDDQPNGQVSDGGLVDEQFQDVGAQLGDDDQDDHGVGPDLVVHARRMVQEQDQTSLEQAQEDSFDYHDWDAAD